MIRRRIAAAVAASAVALSLYLLVVPGRPAASLGHWSSDHYAHYGAAILFWHRGLDVFRRPIRELCPIVDETTGTVKVTAEIRKHPPGIRPGDFAEVQIVTERHQGAKLVPSRAVVQDEGESVVYVIANGKAARRVVKPGFVEGDVTEVLSGLEKGELVCVKGQRDLRDGQAVEILEGPGATASAPAKAPVKTS